MLPMHTEPTLQAMDEFIQAGADALTVLRLLDELGETYGPLTEDFDPGPMVH